MDRCIFKKITGPVRRHRFLPIGYREGKEKPDFLSGPAKSLF